MSGARRVVALLAAACTAGCRDLAPAAAPHQAPHHLLLVSQRDDLVELIDVGCGRRSTLAARHRNFDAVVRDVSIAPDGRSIALALTSAARGDGNPQGASPDAWCWFFGFEEETRTSTTGELPAIDRIHWADDRSRLVFESTEYMRPPTFRLLPLAARRSQLRPTFLEHCFGPPQPPRRNADDEPPVEWVVAPDARRAFSLVEQAGRGAALVVLDLEAGSERTIELDGHVTPNRGGSLQFDRATGALLAAIFEWRAPPPGSESGGEAIGRLLAVDIDRATFELLAIPGFEGLFAVAAGVVVAAGRQDGRSRLCALELATRARTWLEDDGVLAAREPVDLALSADGGTVAVVAQPDVVTLVGALPRPGDAAGSRVPPLRTLALDRHFRESGLVDRRDAERESRRWRFHPAARTVVSFSPDGRWLALARGGWEEIDQGAGHALPAALRVVDLATDRVVVRDDLDGLQSPRELVRGWCVATDDETLH